MILRINFSLLKAYDIGLVRRYYLDVIEKLAIFPGCRLPYCRPILTNSPILYDNELIIYLPVPENLS